MSKYRVTSNGLNLRSEPKVVDATKVAVLHQGQVVDKIEESTTPNWWRVSTVINNIEVKGYVHSAYLAPSESLSQSQDAAAHSGRYREQYHTTTKVTKGTNQKKGVVFHHTAGSIAGALQTILHSKRQAGYHCIVEQDGTRHIFNSPDAILWHAGVSTFKGRNSCNKFMLGVAYTGDTGSRSLTDDEIRSTIEYLAPLWQKHGWSMDWMTTHRAIAPDRKVDISATAEQQLFMALRTHFGA